MRLSLSSAAAPDLDLAGLVEACVQRGLTALELVEGHAHGVSATASEEELSACLRSIGEAGVRIAGFHLPTLEGANPAALARLSARLEAPVVVPGSAVEGLQLSALVDAIASHGGRVLLAHRSDPEEINRVVGEVGSLPEEAVGLAWEVDPRHDDPASVTAVLEQLGPWLCYLRFRGGGPESAEQTGFGVGALMARLTLARYIGPLVLTPSTPKYRYAWSAWLGRAGGWGCGSKQSDPSLVTLAPAASTARITPNAGEPV